MIRKGSVCSRIRNARASLDNAERSFSSNQAVRGELDLMLAEAELHNLRKQRNGRFSWTRQTLALCSAFLLLTAAGFGWWWASSVYQGNPPATADVASSVPADALVKTDAAVPIVKDTGSSVSPAPSAAPGAPVPETGSGNTFAGQEAKVAQNRAEAAAIQPTAPAPGVRLSSGQLQQLVRSGKQELINAH